MDIYDFSAIKIQSFEVKYTKISTRFEGEDNEYSPTCAVSSLGFN